MTTTNFTVESILASVTSILLIIFTYVIPLLSSIRTIHNRDKESYNQWLTYWLLIHLLSPLFNILQFGYYKTFHLSFILWLSLPRFQGAAIIYHEFVDIVLTKYQVEATVDNKLHTVKKSFYSAIWRIAQDVGWGFMYQIGGVVSYVQDKALSLTDPKQRKNHDVSGQKYQNVNSDDDDDDISYESDDDNDSDILAVNHSEKDDTADCNNSIESSNDNDIINESDYDVMVNQQQNTLQSMPTASLSSSSITETEGAEINESIISPSTPTQHNTASRTPIKINTSPIHSIKDSFSSLSSFDKYLMESESNGTPTTTTPTTATISRTAGSNGNSYDTSVETLEYISDFIKMLQKGLYVFAWHNNSSIIHHTDRHGVLLNKGNSITSPPSSSSLRNKFQLRVFSFHSNKMKNAINDNSSCDEKKQIYFQLEEDAQFVLSCVESKSDEDDADIVSFPVSEIFAVQQSTRGIQFLTKSSSTTFLSNTKNSQRSRVRGSSSTKPLSPVDERRQELKIVDGVVVAEIVLSDDNDLNILLFGLKTLLSANNNRLRNQRRQNSSISPQTTTHAMNIDRDYNSSIMTDKKSQELYSEKANRRSDNALKRVESTNSLDTIDINSVK